MMNSSINCSVAEAIELDLHEYLVCIGAPLLGTALLFLSMVACCCVGCIRKRRRENKKPRKYDQSGLETQERGSPIDLATGQKETVLPQSTSLSVEMITNRQQVVIKKSKQQDFCQYASERQIPILPSKQPLARSHEHVPSVSNTPRHTDPNIAKSLTLDSGFLQTPKLGNISDQVVRAKEEKQQIAKEVEPNYEDLATLEQTMHSQQITTAHDYHVLCDPNESEQEQREKKGISESNHGYEELTNVTDVNKQTNTTSQGRYNMLTTAIDMNPLQGAVVQEDTAENPNEDKYYSTTKVHRLVPVGKPINQHHSDHLYQALEEPISQSNYKYDQVQPRHNTFRATNPIGGAVGNLVRSYSHSLEKLDPMYEEPFKQEQRSTSQLDIYSVDSLFDDPKYASKDHTAQTDTTEHQDKGVSFTARSLAKQESGGRKAAIRKTK